MVIYNNLKEIIGNFIECNIVSIYLFYSNFNCGFNIIIGICSFMFLVWLLFLMVWSYFLKEEEKKKIEDILVKFG